jgi:hypothetical protein
MTNLKLHAFWTDGVKHFLTVHNPEVQTLALFVWLISHQPSVFFSHNKPATSNQPTVRFSQNKPAPVISHQPNKQAVK